MNIAWFRDLPKDEQKEFKELVLGSQKVLDKLRKICYNRLEMLVEKVSDKDYQNAAWPYLQAHKNGQIEELRLLLDILDFTKD